MAGGLSGGAVKFLIGWSLATLLGAVAALPSFLVATAGCFLSIARLLACFCLVARCLDHCERSDARGVLP